MLELRPSCEHCQNLLPPDSAEAMICSYECTFCRTCVDKVLRNVCPNCGGGFCARPVRPAADRKDGNFLGNDPASTTHRHKPVNPGTHAELVSAVGHIPHEQR